MLRKVNDNSLLYDRKWSLAYFHNLTVLCCIWFSDPVGYGDPILAVLPSFHDIKWSSIKI